MSNNIQKKDLEIKMKIKWYGSAKFHHTDEDEIRHGIGLNLVDEDWDEDGLTTTKLVKALQLLIKRLKVDYPDENN